MTVSFSFSKCMYSSKAALGWPEAAALQEQGPRAKSWTIDGSPKLLMRRRGVKFGKYHRAAASQQVLEPGAIGPASEVQQVPAQPGLSNTMCDTVTFTHNM